MHNFLAAPNHLKTVVVTLATELAMNEARDLKDELDNNSTGPDLNVDIMVNDSFLRYIKDNNVPEADLPEFLANKIELEKQIIGNTPALPHIDENGQVAIIKKLTPLMAEFV